MCILFRFNSTLAVDRGEFEKLQLGKKFVTFTSSENLSSYQRDDDIYPLELSAPHGRVGRRSADKAVLYFTNQWRVTKAELNCTNHYCSIINRVEPSYVVNRALLWIQVTSITASKGMIMSDIQGKNCSTAFFYSRWKLYGISCKVWSSNVVLVVVTLRCVGIPEWSIMNRMIVSCVHIHIVVFVLITSECSISSVNNSNSQRTRILRTHVRPWKFNVKARFTTNVL